MTLAIIRRFTSNDENQLNVSAQRFAERHGLALDAGDVEIWGAQSALQEQLHDMHMSADPRANKLVRLWRACFCRALHVNPDASITIDHGYIGYWLND